MNNKLKPLQTIHLALCGGVFLFALITIFLNRDIMFFDANPAHSAPFNPIFPIMGLMTITASIYFFRNVISKVDKTAATYSKIDQYQSAFIIGAALLEGGALFNVVGFYLTHNAFFLIFAFANFVFLALRRPTKEKLISDLNIPYPDSEML